MGHSSTNGCVDAHIDIPLRNENQAKSIPRSRAAVLVPALPDRTFGHSIEHVEMGFVRPGDCPVVLSLT